MSDAPSDSEVTDLRQLAVALRANTVKLRFFRGATYDGDADTYLTQLTQFIDAVMPMLGSAQAGPKSALCADCIACGCKKDCTPQPAGLAQEAQLSREHIVRVVLQAYGFTDHTLDDLTWLRNTHAYAVASRVADALAG
jgi:hypothetical protein